MLFCAGQTRSKLPQRLEDQQLLGVRHKGCAHPPNGKHDRHAREQPELPFYLHTHLHRYGADGWTQLARGDPSARAVPHRHATKGTGLVAQA